MYKQFFGLKDNPFNVTPDPRYLYLTPHTEEALACMQYCVTARKGFVMLTGDVGTGKTTLLNKLLEWLRQEQIASAFVFNPRLNPFQFLDYALSDFGINCATRLKSAILSELNQWLLERYKAGSTAVLIVDEAQDASPEVLEEIRLLANLETPSGKLLQIVLAGQQEFEMKLRLPEFRQLRQRITLRSKTHPLSPVECREYVATRLRVAGSDGRQIFTPTALEALHFYSEGIPRVINILCEDSLINAFVDQKPLVSKEIVEGVAKELELDIYPPTSPLPLDSQTPYPRRREPLRPSSDASDLSEAAPAVRKAPAPASPPKGPAPGITAPVARVAPSPGPMARQEASATPATTKPVWEEPDAIGSPKFPSDRNPPAPRPSTAMRGSTATSPAAANGTTPDEEILQTLKVKLPPAKLQPVQPAVRSAQPPVGSFAATPTQKAKWNPPQGWIIWAAVAFTLMLGGMGAILLLRWKEPVPTPPPVAAAPAASAPELASPAPTTTPSTSPPIASAAQVPQPATETRAIEPSTPPPQIESRVEENKPLARASRPQVAKPLPAARVRPQTEAAKTAPTEELAAGPKAGGLMVTANLEGARIHLDGQTMSEWLTPQIFSRLSVGTHRVTVTKPGYEDVSAQVVIQDGRTATFRAQLTPAGGEINIVTNPPGLSVSIDGGQFTPSPFRGTVGAGRHTYRIKLPNGRIYEGSFEMRTGAIITRQVDFSAGEWLSTDTPQ